MNEPTQITEKEMAEYKRIQRECEKKAKRIFILRPGVGPGDVIQDLDGKKYRIAEDGSRRRI